MFRVLVDQCYSPNITCIDPLSSFGERTIPTKVLTALVLALSKHDRGAHPV